MAAPRTSEPATTSANATTVPATEPGTAPAASRPVPRSASYAATAVPTERERHLMNRLGQGFTPVLLAQLRAAGGERAWFEQQLDPASLPDGGTAEAVAGWFPRLTQDSPAQKKRSDDDGSYKAYSYGMDLANYTLQRRIYSHRTLLESMTDFWSTHLHVNARHFPGFTQRYGYDRTIREHALGRFEDLLVAATLHPAMLMFLDNYRSVRDRPNENHGRELLELHTVGKTAGYTEAMVLDSAKILSGWTVDLSTYEAFYDPARHTSGRVSVLGFSNENGSADGSGLTRDYLRYLARHEATARTLCFKLARRFVSDNPPGSLVDALVATYLSTGTDIKAVLRHLVDAPEFWRSVGEKVRTPVDDIVATARVLDVQAQAPVDSSSYVHELTGSVRSVKLYQWPRPDGPPDTADAWTSPSRMLNSWRSHWGLSGGYYPNGEVVHRTPASWLPQSRIRHDRLIDHMCRVLLGRPATERLVGAVVLATQVPAHEQITSSHPLVRYRFLRLLTALLDTPEHMTR